MGLFPLYYAVYNCFDFYVGAPDMMIRFSIFHFIQHYLVYLHTSMWLHSNIYFSSNCEMIAARKRCSCCSLVNRLNTFYKIFYFFAGCSFTCCILKIGRIRRVYASDIFRKNSSCISNHFSCCASSLNRAATFWVVITFLYVVIKFNLFQK
jgi:hypothetical protein